MLEKFKNGPLALVAVVAWGLAVLWIGHLLRHLLR
jgi:hypothetical protein